MIIISKLELEKFRERNNLKFERVYGLYELVSGSINKAHRRILGVFIMKEFLQELKLLLEKHDVCIEGSDKSVMLYDIFDVYADTLFTTSCHLRTSDIDRFIKELESS